MFSTVGEEETFAYWITELNQYESLDQWGAQEILQSVLEATEDMGACWGVMNYELLRWVWDQFHSYQNPAVAGSSANTSLITM